MWRPGQNDVTAGRGTASAAAQLPAAIAGRLDSGQERRPYAVPLQFPDGAGSSCRPGRSPASRRMTGCSPVSRSMVAAPKTTCLTMSSGDRARHAEQDARVDHRLDQEVDVGRAAARQRRRRVLLGLGNPQYLADRAEAVPRPGAAAPRSRGPRPRSRSSPRRRAPGVLDMTRTTGRRRSAARSMNAVGMPAATEMTSLSAATTGAISSSSTAMSCGLTAISSVSARPWRPRPRVSTLMP